MSHAVKWLRTHSSGVRATNLPRKGSKIRRTPSAPVSIRGAVSGGRLSGGRLCVIIKVRKSTVILLSWVATCRDRKLWERDVKLRSFLRICNIPICYRIFVAESWSRIRWYIMIYWQKMCIIHIFHQWVSSPLLLLTAVMEISIDQTFVDRLSLSPIALVLKIIRNFAKNKTYIICKRPLISKQIR